MVAADMAESGGVVDTTIEVIDEEKGKTPPIAAYFPSGFIPKQIQSKKYPIVRTFRNQNRPKRVELVVKPSGSLVDYVGTNYSGEAAAGKLGSLRLLSINWDSCSAEFVPIVSGKVFRLEPRVRKLDMLNEEPATPSKTELTYEERSQQLGMLTERFGTGNAKKKARQLERIRDLDDPDSKEELKHILEKGDVPKAAIEGTSTKIYGNLPPHDVSATTPESAYPLDKIILSGEMNHVDDILKLLQAGEEMDSNVYASFVCNRKHKVVLLKDEEEKIKAASVLSYINHLVNFKNKHSLEGFSTAKHHIIPSMLLQKFSRLFLNAEKKRIADDKIEAILSYIAVLTLHIDEFESDISDIARDLKMSVLSLRPYFENLGCKFRSRNKVTVATLPVPLNFPTARKKRRRG